MKELVPFAWFGEVVRVAEAHTDGYRYVSVQPLLRRVERLTTLILPREMVDEYGIVVGSILKVAISSCEVVEAQPEVVAVR